MTVKNKKYTRLKMSRKANVSTVYQVNSFRDTQVAINKMMDYFDANTNLQFSMNPTWIEAMLLTAQNIINFYEKISSSDQNHYYSNAMAMIASAKRNLQKGLYKIKLNTFAEADYYLGETFNDIYDLEKFFSDFKG